MQNRQRHTRWVAALAMLGLVACRPRNPPPPQQNPETVTPPATCEEVETPKPIYEVCDGRPFTDPWEFWGGIDAAQKAFGARRISYGATIEEGGGDSPALSGDGNWVAFVSETAIDGNDGNGKRDVYIRDRARQRTMLVSARSEQPPGQEFPTYYAGNDSSDEPAISNDGCVIAFSSRASDLVRNDTNGKSDVFVWDRCRGRIELVSRRAGLAGFEPFPSIGASYRPSLTADGRYVVYSSDGTDLVAGDAPSNGHSNVYLYDRVSQTTRRLTHGLAGDPDAASTDAVINALGTRVAFASQATNLVAGDINQRADVFYLDLTPGAAIQLASAGVGGQPGDGHSAQPAINESGDVIAFTSLASNLLAGDAAQIADTNSAADIYVRNLRRNTVRRVSLGWSREYKITGASGSWIVKWKQLAPGTVSARPAIDASGTRVAYYTTSALALEFSGEGDFCITNLWDDNAVSDVIVAELDGAGGPVKANQVASVTQLFPVPNRSPEVSSADPVWTFERELGNGASRTDSAQLFSRDGSQLVFTSLATNLAGIDEGPGAYFNQYRCQVNPALPRTKRWQPIPLWSKAREGYDVFVSSLNEPPTFLCAGTVHYPPKSL